MELLSWCREICYGSDTLLKSEAFDLVIVGGSIAGCAASITAAEQGLKAALVHDCPVLGGNASSEIRVHTEGITWKAVRIVNMLNTVWWPDSSPDRSARSVPESYR
jgi:alkyl hydroperoxide reductase subunit AhpF